MKVDSGPIYIISTVDDNYAQHYGAMVCSLLENKRDTTRLEIYLIDGGLSEENKEKIASIADTYNTSISILNIDKKPFASFMISAHISLSAYYRIMIPDIIPSHIEKIIYIDCDMIILDDLSSLWNIDISNFAIGAIHDVEGSLRKPDLAMPAKSMYFNSGLMLMNIPVWREHNISNDVMRYIQENGDKIVLWDQDALNAVLFDQCLKLPNKYNVMIRLTHNKSERLYWILPAILHYIGPEKPSHRVPINDLSKHYFVYLNMTPWGKTIKPTGFYSHISKYSQRTHRTNRYLRRSGVLIDLWRSLIPRDIKYTDVKYRFLGKHPALHSFLKRAKRMIVNVGR